MNLFNSETMFHLPPRDKCSSIIAKNNLFTSIYILIILYILHLSENLFRMGNYENLKIVSVLFILEFVKYFFYKSGKISAEPKMKKKMIKMETIFRDVLFILQMIIVFYGIAVLLGAAFLSKLEQTIMFSSLLTVLVITPAVLYLEVNDIFQLLDLITQPPKDNLSTMVMLQFQLTLLGAWLGAVPIPLDWDREWQIWPNSCVLGTLGGYFIANITSYVLQTTDIFSRNKKNQRMKNML